MKALFGLTGMVVMLAAAGCERPFARSDFFNGVKPKAVLTAISEQEGIRLNVSFEFEETTRDYSLKECTVVLNCDQAKGRAVLVRFARQLRDQVQASGAKLTGTGETPDYSRERIPFRTDMTAGQLIFYSTDIGDRRVKLNFVAFECKRR